MYTFRYVLRNNYFPDQFYNRDGWVHLEEAEFYNRREEVPQVPGTTVVKVRVQDIVVIDPDEGSHKAYQGQPPLYGANLIWCLGRKGRGTTDQLAYFYKEDDAKLVAKLLNEQEAKDAKVQETGREAASEGGN